MCENFFSYFFGFMLRAWRRKTQHFRFFVMILFLNGTSQRKGGTQKNTKIVSLELTTEQREISRVFKLFVRWYGKLELIN